MMPHTVPRIEEAVELVQSPAPEVDAGWYDSLWKACICSCSKFVWACYIIAICTCLSWCFNRLRYADRILTQLFKWMSKARVRRQQGVQSNGSAHGGQD